MWIVFLVGLERPRNLHIQVDLMHSYVTNVPPSYAALPRASTDPHVTRRAQRCMYGRVLRPFPPDVPRLRAFRVLRA